MPALDTSVKIFDSTFPGAPVLSGTAGSLIAVLDACLVNGFGLKTCDSVTVSGGVATATINTGHSAIRDAVVLIAGATPIGLNGEHKVISTTTTTVVFDAFGVADDVATGTITLKLAPAGWGKPFVGTNLASYCSLSPAASGSYLRVDDTSATDPRVIGYESMTDVNTGAGPFPLGAQVSGGMYWPKAHAAGGSARKWWLIADAGMIYLGVAYHTSYVDQYVSMYAGDVLSRKAGDGYRFVVSGLVSAGSAQSVQATLSFARQSLGSGARAYAPRSYTQLGSAVEMDHVFLGAGTSGVSGKGPNQYPNGPDNALILVDVHVTEKAALAYRATLPGVLFSTQAVIAGIANDSPLDALPGLPGRRVLWKQVGDFTASSIGGFAIDVSGPWS